MGHRKLATFNKGHRKSPETILQNPNYFLQSIDPSSKTLKFIKTTRDTLSTAAFIDGRSELTSDNNIYSVKIEDALRWQKESIRRPATDRFIFHISFCGSTLLARACDIAGKAFTYKEPQVLIDLANFKNQKHPCLSNKDDWENLINLTLQQFRSGFTPGEISLIKPSNWINSILPELFHSQKTSKAIFMTIAPREFLIAVLRGGRKRITYTCNFLMNMQTAFPEYSHLIEQAAPLNSDPLLGAARLILTTYYMQKTAFERATQNIPQERYNFLSYEDLLSRPEESLALTSKTLGMSLKPEDIKQSMNTVLKLHSKNKDKKYDILNAKENDQKIEQEYNHVIIPALDWYYDMTKDIIICT